jgi:hypothetical protein
MAVDGFGREIVVRAPTKLDPLLFDRFNTLAHRQVWIGYDESDATPPAFGFDVCEVENSLRRTLETWRLEIDPGTRTRDDVIVDGRVVDLPPDPPVAGELYLPPDTSVPYQELPADDTADPLWLVRLGTVQWDGNTQRFVAAATGRLGEGRAYVGAVAAELLAPTPALTIRSRLAPVDPAATEFARVEGPLRVTGRLVAEQDVYVDGGVVRLNYTSGDTDSVDLWLGRRRGPADVGHRLRVHLGDDPGAATTSLTVGPGVGSDEKTVLAVQANDVVEVPTGTLRFGAQVRQMVDLWASTEAAGKAPYGIGVQSGTLYQRTGSQFCWFRGGEHDAGAGVPGAGGVTQLRLDFSGHLYLEETVHKQGLQLHGSGWGIGTQPNVLYQRSPGTFAWYRGGLESPTDLDAGGGALAMALAPGALTVYGDAYVTSDLVVGHNANGFVKVRHVDGKSYVNDNDDHLYLNWSSGKDVVVGQPGFAGTGSNLLVAGNLKVYGTDDAAFRVRGYEMSRRNDTDNPWSLSVAADFSQIFDAFAVLQGFSIFDNSNQPNFDNFSRLPDPDAIVQHCYVRVTGIVGTTVNGVTFCSESAAFEGDNTVLFTVIVFGRKV